MGARQHTSLLGKLSIICVLIPVSAFKVRGTAPEGRMESIHYPIMRTAPKQGAGWPGLASAWTREGFCQGYRHAVLLMGSQMVFHANVFSCYCSHWGVSATDPPVCEAPPRTTLHYNVVQEQDQQSNQCSAGRKKMHAGASLTMWNNSRKIPIWAETIGTSVFTKKVHYLKRCSMSVCASYWNRCCL